MNKKNVTTHNFIHIFTIIYSNRSIWQTQHLSDRKCLDDGTGIGIEVETDRVNDKSRCRDADIGLGGIVFRNISLIVIKQNRQGTPAIRIGY